MEAITQNTKGLNLNAETKEKLARIANDAAAAEDKHRVAAQKVTDTVHKQNEATNEANKQTQQMVSQLERWLATMVVMRGLSSMWNSMTDYAKNYYDAMNEIRIVTGYTEEQAEHLGERYRQMAQELSVSSTEIAKAAVEFWRQGLPEDEVESRLKATTVYAKISAMDFAEAAELMTAATNAMGVEAGHVADVWAYLGDASASGADEIGIAMQRVSAVATSAGISFEQLGAYIATLSEKTRQAPQVIGTALNSIISRLQQVKQNGFKDEDGLGINDIAKALSALKEPIKIMENDEWRAFPDILNDIAAQWQDLTDKEKAYIATTMGGTRQRNYLLTLLDDLSKSAEGNSRAMELYKGALESTGVAMDKYATYEESVTAAQGRLNAAMEEFYSTLMNGSILRGWYDGLATIVNIINKATESTGGLNIGLGLLAAAITLGYVAFNKLSASMGGAATVSGVLKYAFAGVTTSATGATVATSALGMALRAVGVGIVVAGIAGLVGWLVSLGKEAGNTKVDVDALNTTLSNYEKEISNINNLKDEVTRLAESYSGAKTDITEFNKMRQQIISTYPELKMQIGQEVTDVNQLAGAYENLIGVLSDYSYQKAMQAWNDAYTGRSGYIDEYNKATSGLYTRNKDFLDSSEWTTNSLSAKRGLNWYRSADKSDWTAADYMTAYARADDIRQYLANIGEDITYADNVISELYAGMIAKTNQYDKQLRDALTGIVKGAIDPGHFKEALESIPSITEMIVDQLVEEGRNGALQDPTYRATELANSIGTYVENMTASVSKYVSDYNLNPSLFSSGLTDKVTQAFLTQLENAPVKITDETAKHILEPWFNAIGQSIDTYFDGSNPLKEAISAAQKEIESMLTWGKPENNQGRAGAARVGSIITDLLDLGASTDQIEGILIPFFKKIGTASDEFWNNLRIVRSDEINDIARGAATAAFGESLNEAMAYLEQIEKIQDTIDKIKKNGLDSDNITALEAILGLDQFEETWQKTLDEDLGIEGFMQALYDKIASVRESMEMNPIAAMLGTPSEEEIHAAIDKLTKSKDLDAFVSVWDGLKESVKTAIMETYGDIEALITDSEAAVAQSAEKLETTLDKIKRDAEIGPRMKKGELWGDMDDMLDDIAEGGDKVNKAFADVQTRIDSAAMAAAALTEAANGNTEALDYLAKATGLSAESLANDLTAAEYYAQEASLQAGNSVAYLAQMLLTAGAIEIDPSGKVAAIGSIQEAAANAGLTVAQFAAALASMDGASFSMTPNKNGTGMVVSAKVKQINWNSARAKTLSGSRGSGSGRSGGGGGGSMKVSEAVTNLLEDISANKAIEDYRRELAQLAQSYYKETGQLQGVILYLGIERDIVNENTSKLEEYVAQIESEIEARKAIIASEKAGSTAYKQAMMDLEKLQEDHQKYSKELMKNKTDVEALTKAIKEQNDAIRQMEIDLRNTVLKAIEDREAAEEKMLDGRIAMENEILDLLKTRYEKERDEILETENAKKAALQAEIDRIDELLNERKKLAEQEDKMQQIAELEEKIARISADPTRQKEAATMRQQIAKLREDMAWDQAEAEAEAQKKSLEQQVKSLDDYIAYVNDYYEELFKNPQKLMEEMKHILEGTDEEIISWLKQNSEDYQTATESTQKKMVKSWQDTLDQMRDTIRTHWEEVEQIIAGGDENIITFLQTYTEEYRKAGKLQAEAYTDEWKKQLDDLKKAHEEVTGTINTYDYTKIDTSGSGSGGSGSGGGGSSGGSGSSGSSSSGNTTAKAGSHKYGYKNANGKWVEVSGTTDTLAFAAAKAAGIAHYQKSTTINDIQKAVIVGQLQNATKSNLGSYLKKYAAGGMNTTTGLAWLDGTASRPERILSAYQTELFEDLLGTLHMIRKVNINSVTSAPRFRATNQMPNIDTINVTVENLNSDTDYGEAAEKMMNEFYKKLARTRPVGGIQGW